MASCGATVVELTTTDDELQCSRPGAGIPKVILKFVDAVKTKYH